MASELHADFGRNGGDFMNLGGFTEIRDQLLAQLKKMHDAGDCTANLDEEISDLRELEEALIRAGVSLVSVSGNGSVLVADHHWGDYVKDTAYDLDMVQEGSVVDKYVDWDGVADDWRREYAEVTVEAGEFAGKWWVKH